MYEVVGWSTDELDRLAPDRPRHLLGIGDVDDLIRGVELGIDTFDCAMPTRLARHGVAIVPDPDARWRVSLDRPVWRGVDEPLLPGCPCSACAGGLSRAYLHYLARNRDLTGARLLTEHNLVFLRRLMADLRSAVIAGTLAQTAAAFRAGAAPGSLGGETSTPPARRPGRSRDRWIDSYRERISRTSWRQEMETTTEPTTTQVYRVYIRATPEAIWTAITDPDWSARYGYGSSSDYDLRPGEPFRGLSTRACSSTCPRVVLDGPRTGASLERVTRRGRHGSSRQPERAGSGRLQAGASLSRAGGLPSSRPGGAASSRCGRRCRLRRC